MPDLIERRKWLKDRSNIQVGDVVLVVDSQAPRGEWIYGRIIEVYTGKDGVVRSTKVRTSKGDYVRPTCKLCLLETVEENSCS